MTTYVEAILLTITPEQLLNLQTDLVLAHPVEDPRNLHRTLSLILENDDVPQVIKDAIKPQTEMLYRLINMGLVAYGTIQKGKTDGS